MVAIGDRHVYPAVHIRVGRQGLRNTVLVVVIADRLEVLVAVGIKLVGVHVAVKVGVECVAVHGAVAVEVCRADVAQTVAVTVGERVVFQ
ncbi:hypothetical protein D9M72_446480 [compost metagenome]